MSPHVHCFMMESAEDDETEWEEEIENEPALNGMSKCESSISCSS